jgi:hypothetical protein
MKISAAPARLTRLVQEINSKNRKRALFSRGSGFLFDCVATRLTSDPSRQGRAGGMNCLPITSTLPIVPPSVRTIGVSLASLPPRPSQTVQGSLLGARLADPVRLGSSRVPVCPRDSSLSALGERERLRGSDSTSGHRELPEIAGDYHAFRAGQIAPSALVEGSEPVQAISQRGLADTADFLKSESEIEPPNRVSGRSGFFRPNRSFSRFHGVGLNAVEASAEGDDDSKSRCPNSAQALQYSMGEGLEDCLTPQSFAGRAKAKIAKVQAMSPSHAKPNRGEGLDCNGTRRQEETKK